MSKIKTDNKVYSRFKEGCTAVLLGEPDAQGNQAARIIDPDINDGEPFVSLTKPYEWSPVPLVPRPADIPEFVEVILWLDGDGTHMDVVSVDEDWSQWNESVTVGRFTVRVPAMLTPLT